MRSQGRFWRVSERPRANIPLCASCASMGLLARSGRSQNGPNWQAGHCTRKNGQAMRIAVKNRQTALVRGTPLKPFDLLRRATPLRCFIGEGTRGGSPARRDSLTLCSPAGNEYFSGCSLCNFAGRLCTVGGKYTLIIRALCTLYECRLYKR